MCCVGCCSYSIDHLLLQMPLESWSLIVISNLDPASFPTDNNNYQLTLFMVLSYFFNTTITTPNNASATSDDIGAGHLVDLEVTVGLWIQQSAVPCSTGIEAPAAAFIQSHQLLMCESSRKALVMPPQMEKKKPLPPLIGNWNYSWTHDLAGQVLYRSWSRVRLIHVREEGRTFILLFIYCSKWIRKALSM